MKWKLLLCGAALVVAGCSSPQNPFAGYENAPFTYDLVPEPVPDLSPGLLDTLYPYPPAGAVASAAAVK